jgi:hypothetical protein
MNAWNSTMKRREFWTRLAGMGAGVAGLAKSVLPVEAQVAGPDSTEVAEIYQLQAAYHRAKSTQDIDLMMSLWDSDAVLYIQGDPNPPYIGFDRLKAFFLNSGSFRNRRFSLVPSFKIQIRVYGQQAWLYFECHDVGNFDLDTRFIAADAFLAGTVRKLGRDWLFWNMTAGGAFPLSVDHYYFP